METPPNALNTKEFEVTGVSRSGRVRKKSSKLLDFQSPDDVEKKVYKRTTSAAVSRHSAKYIGRGRPSLATLRARRHVLDTGERADIDDVALDDDDDAEMETESDVEGKQDRVMNMDQGANNSGEDDDDDDNDNLDDVLANNANLTANSDSDDGFGELVADLVDTEGGNMNNRNSGKKDSKVRKSLYMSEKRLEKDSCRLKRKDKGKSRYTAYSLWAREYRKSSKYGKEVDFSNARRELWANVSNKDKSNWRRKAKVQASKAKALEKSGFSNKDGEKIDKTAIASNPNSTFINRPTTSRTKKLAEDKQKAKDELAVVKPTSHTSSKKPRNNSYTRKSASSSHNVTKSKGDAVSLYASTNGSTTNNLLSNSSTSSINMPLPTIEAIDAAAHLKLLGESLTIIGDRLKEHDGQIAVSGSLSVLLDSLLCSLGPLLCLTTNLPGLDKKPQLKANLATTLDNIAYVMPGL